MDPYTVAILGAYTATVNAWTMFFQAASPEQKVQMVQDWLDLQKFWRDLFGQLPKGKA